MDVTRWGFSVSYRMPGFSTETFRAILKLALDAGYTFQRFDATSVADRRIWLRHDVDISPRMALRLGEVARECGVVSNLFFQLNAEPYSFSPRKHSTS